MSLTLFPSISYAKTHPLLLLLSILTMVYAADTIHVYTWNSLNYSIANNDGRTVSYKKILDEIQPDVIVVQEMVESVWVEKFVAEVLDSRWLLSPFIDGSDTNNMLYYDQDKLILPIVLGYQSWICWGEKSIQSR